MSTPDLSLGAVGKSGRPGIFPHGKLLAALKNEGMAMSNKPGKFFIVMLIAISLGVAGCASSSGQAKSGNAATTVAAVAGSAPVLAKQFNAVYAYLVEQKLVPDHRDAATKALAAMDAVAPLVQQGAQALQGDNFNWANFILQAALATAQALGYILPLVV